MCCFDVMVASDLGKILVRVRFPEAAPVETTHFWVVFDFLVYESSKIMTKLGTCEVCHRDIIREEYHDYVVEGCSNFCATTTPEEKLALKELQAGEYGVWPCSECGSAIADTYELQGHCSGCTDKVALRTQQTKITLLEKELLKIQNEASLWKKEAEAAYKYNKDLNKWWQFKLDRLKLTYQHSGVTPSLPWKKVAKKLSLQVKKLDLECEQLNQQCNELLNHRSEISAFLKAITQETALQKEKYSENDKIKHDPDWYRLIVYLSGKALYNPDVGSASPVETQKRRIVAIAAAACNWWNTKTSEQ